MTSSFKQKFIQVTLTFTLLCAVKLQDPQTSYLELLKAAPAVYNFVEKVTNLQTPIKKDKKNS